MEKKCCDPPPKQNCSYWPPPSRRPEPAEASPTWENHPSWTAGIEALRDYNRWVDAIVLPIVFQWIEEHKEEVYATVPEELKDDIGVVIAAAFKLVAELPAYKTGQEKRAAYEAAPDDTTVDPSKVNPVWTGIVKKIRAGTNEAFAEQSSVLGDTIP